MEIHVSTRDGQPAKYPPHQVLAMWRRGELTPDMVYWRRGMADWRPLAEFIADEEPVVPVPEPEETAPRYSFLREPARSTAHLKFMLWLSAALGLVAAGSDFLQWQALRHGAANAATVADGLNRQSFIGTLGLVVSLTTQISLLVWAFRTNANSHGFGAQGMRFRPWWAVLQFILPFLNLILPYFMFRELYQVARDPQNWQAQPVPNLLRAWWFLWIVSNLSASFAVWRSMNMGESPAELLALTPLLIVAHLLQATSSLLTHMVVNAIYYHQLRLVAGDELDDEPQGA